MPERPRVAVIAALALLAGWCGAAFAQTDISLNRAGSGARASGMGDAFIAVSDDGTAASWNPAGLAQLRQPEFSLVYGIADRRLDLSALRSLDGTFAYSSHGASQSTASIDFASAALPFAVAGKGVTLQVGWHRLYQLTGLVGGQTQKVSLADPAFVPVSIDREDRLDGDIHLLSVATAVKVTGRAAIGASVNFWRGDWTERITLSEDPGPTGAPALYNALSHDRISGENVSVGLLLTYPSWNLGFVHHWPFWSSYRAQGDRRSTASPSGSVAVENARFHLPRSMGLGIARRLPSRWTAAASVTRDEWTRAVVDGIPGVPGEINFFDGLPPPISTSRDTVSVNLGVEHLVVRDGSVIPLRAGFGWEPQGGMDPVTRDPVDYHLAAVGAGYNTNAFKLDMAVQLRWGGVKLTAPLSVAALLGSQLTPDAIGQGDSREWRIKLSVIYRLQDTEKLKGALHRIFG
jgi:hypothetical protein